jgi:hypothetical protein
MGYTPSQLIKTKPKKIKNNKLEKYNKVEYMEVPY